MFMTGIVVAGLMQGCATNVTKPSAAPKPAVVRFGTFSNVVLEPVVFAEPFTAAGPNQTAAKKINELLMDQLARVFPDMNSAGKKVGNTLIIKPVIKDIRFVNKKARTYGGAMAGSSAILMEITYLEKETQAVVARVEFYDYASAFAGNISVGKSDIKMLSNIVTQIVNYSSANR